MREQANLCLLVERIRHVRIGILGSGNEARAGHSSPAHLSLFSTNHHDHDSKGKPSASELGFLLRTSTELGGRLVGQASKKSVPLLGTAHLPFFSFDWGGESEVAGVLLYMVFLELFGGVQESQESNGTVPFGGLVIGDDCL